MVVKVPPAPLPGIGPPALKLLLPQSKAHCGLHLLSQSHQLHHQFDNSSPQNTKNRIEGKLATRSCDRDLRLLLREFNYTSFCRAIQVYPP